MQDNSNFIKKKVLILASTFPRWPNDDTPPFVYHLARRLSDDFNMFVLAPDFPGSKKEEQWGAINIRRFQYFWPAKYQKVCYQGGILSNLNKNKLFYIQVITLLLFQFLAAVRMIRKENIRLVHAHWIMPQGLVALAVKKLLGVPYIITVHGGDIFSLQGTIMAWLKKKVLANAAEIIAVSNSIRNEILKKIDPKLEVTIASMGVDANFFTPTKRDLSLKDRFNISGPFLLFIGRLAEKKGVNYLLQAMPAIIEAFPQTKLMIVGGGPLKEELVDAVKKLKLNNDVIFLGGLPNAELPKFYATADIFIGPSIRTKDGDTEGLGLTFVEAVFSGCVPIGTDVGGISDVIINDETGMIVTQRNSTAISAAVIKLLNHPDLMNRLKEKARKMLVEKFDWSVIAAKYKSIYIQH